MQQAKDDLKVMIRGFYGEIPLRDYWPAIKTRKRQTPGSKHQNMLRWWVRNALYKREWLALIDVPQDKVSANSDKV